VGRRLSGSGEGERERRRVEMEECKGVGSGTVDDAQHFVYLKKRVRRTMREQKIVTFTKLQIARDEVAFDVNESIGPAVSIGKNVFKVNLPEM